MSNGETEFGAAQDKFETYFAERLWEWVPEIYKVHDEAAPNPNVLRALVQVIGREAAVARRSVDRLWEDEFIEFCDDWAVPYLGDLVKTRLISALNRRGRRVDVAKTIFYRRRKGTPLVLEQLIEDITGWEGVMIEAFRRLVRARHLLDPKPLRLRGRMSKTMPAGWADLRRQNGADLLYTPFDEFYHVLDFRRLRGIDGRFNIPKLNFHLFRLLPFEVEFSTPFLFNLGGEDRYFTFDPSGRDVPLFRKCRRRDEAEWRPGREWDIAGPMRCRLLGHAEYVITPAIAAGFSPDISEPLGKLVGLRIEGERRLLTRLQVLEDEFGIPGDIVPHFHEILAEAITDDSGKTNLIPESVSVLLDESPFNEVARDEVMAGNLADWEDCFPTPFDAGVELLIDPERGRFAFTSVPPDPADVVVRRYFYGFSGNLGAGTYDRRDFIAPQSSPAGAEWSGGGATSGTFVADAVNTFLDSKTYESPGSAIVVMADCVIQAANFQRPYMLRQANTAMSFNGSSPDPNSPATLTLEGVWYGQSTPNVDGIRELRFTGTWDRITISHSTLDPGGLRADLSQIPAIVISIRGFVETLVIDSSIVGPVLVDKANGGRVERIQIRDSIVDASRVVGGSNPNLGLLTILGEVEMERVTVLGDVKVNRLSATEALIDGLTEVTDNQNGCFRFSAAEPDSKLPPQFESHVLNVAGHFFTSRRFGDPGYAQLSETAPLEIVRGAENGAEMGAFNSLLNPIKLDGLRAKVEEFQPVGLIPQYVNET